MLLHMKTTIVLPDPLFARLKKEAAAQRRTLSDLVEAALVSFLERGKETKRRKPLPTFKMGPARVDLADREALYAAMDRDPVRR